ncbi:MAG: DUF4276 family protein [Saprospiraceae bacterium]|nr:DUF4276 family protein [Saprospiraceae bacterium]
MAKKLNWRKPMIRVNVLCEGITEKLFVSRILYPHFIEREIVVSGSSLDGGFTYGRLKYNIIEWLNNDQDAYLTTLVDLYGMSKKYPGYKDSKHLAPVEKVLAIENAVKQDVLSSPNLHNHKFIPYFQLHEFEALLFSDTQMMEDWLSLDLPIPKGSFEAIRNAFETPEHINDSPLTAPSKRLEAVTNKRYDKVEDGIIIAKDIGLGKIRQACPHFDSFIRTIEHLGSKL